MATVANPTHDVRAPRPTVTQTSTVGATSYQEYNRQRNVHQRAAESSTKSDHVAPDILVPEKLNLNAGFLLMIARVADEFCVVKCNSMTAAGRSNLDTYYQMWEQLDLLENILFCKQDVTKQKEIKDRLDVLLEKIKQSSFSNEVGRYIDQTIYFEVRRELGSLFEDLMVDMERRGILTVKAEDPLKAMGKFSD